ncbi:MAG: cobalt-precorrin-7 (C(5))-methyltransferase [Methanomicrobiales archaeon]|nr:cobalt-precorrin-7 (C(5))-methyltransferase [Methanomicrobiales archaeon]
MKIVGVGCGPGMLTEAAIAAIRGAKKCYGSERAITLAMLYLMPYCEIHKIADYQTLRDLHEEDAVVLSTGDPLFGGLGYLDGEIIPGISSLQLACARLKISWLRVVALSAHAKDRQQPLEILRKEILQGKVVFLLADPQFDIKGCAEFLCKSGISCDLAVCENLGYPEERIAVGSTDSPPQKISSLFSLVIGTFRP